MKKLFLNRKEVTELLGVSDRTVTRKIKSGELKVVTKNKKQLFPKEQFESIEKKDQNTFESVIEILQEQLQDKQQQLQEKDKQIEQLQERLKEQGELVRNEQVLSKGLQEKLILLPEPKQGLFGRLFNKRSS